MNSARWVSLSTAEPLSVGWFSLSWAVPPAAGAKVDRPPATSVRTMVLRLMKPTSSVSSLVMMPTCSPVSTEPASGSDRLEKAELNAVPSR